MFVPICISIMHNLLREYVGELLNELRWDKEMIDLYKMKTRPLSAASPIDALHMWMLSADVAVRVGNDIALNPQKISQDEYEAMKRYVVPRYEGLLRQYRRSKDPAQSAISALTYYLANYYNTQIVSGRLKRRMQRPTRPMRAAPGSKSHDDNRQRDDDDNEPPDL